ncbi:MAG: polysaccharide deacetylase family protein [Desulfobulbus sp.]|jgi:peptidoglycan/xylan/chitin deacetylase (PgdA/CDA1 family)|uniref:polysaccharide deacetylase family protein n=1 Tax=Desulfobulbus sp. TaxID=895 RepID=UPI00284900E8|nr:polysaccharide deacetylase family protein [Desulfobulbus sp.]MDR2548928.1 polysaccharide deacetylase family protein [Desulfobulbus sp.]
MRRSRPWSFSLAEKTGMAALLTAIPLGLTAAPQIAAGPLALFLLACLAAPFLPRSSFFLPVICRGTPGRKGIALTFDDGPFPASTPILLELLARYRLPATFFVVGEQAAAHPELIAAILAQGHSIGNHSYRHDHLLMLRSCEILEADIRRTQDVLARTGMRPLFFRPPIGITSPRLRPALASQNLQALTFSCRVFDRGNRNIRNLAARVLGQLQPGDILLLHDNPPVSEEDTIHWVEELHCLLGRLSQEHRIVPLANLIDQPVMVAEEH